MIKKIKYIKKISFVLCFFILFLDFSFTQEEIEKPNLKKYKQQFQSSMIENITPNLFLVDENYVLGPGDSIAVYLEGSIQQMFTATVVPGGKIFIPVIGELEATGSTIKQLREQLKTALLKYYKNFEVVVQLIGRSPVQSLSKAEAIFGIKGEVEFPGIYELRKGEKISQAVFASGGFNIYSDLKKASIERITEDKMKKTIPVDLYEVLVQKNKELDIELKNGDNIVIPSFPRFVSVSGEVKKPGGYEHVNGAPVLYYIGIAGGFTEEASREGIIIKKINGAEQQVDYSYIPEAGDIVIVGKIFFRFVTLKDYMQLAFDFLAIYGIYSLIFKK